MKKTMMIVCALYATQSSAMYTATKIVALATSPVTVPGICYVIKTLADREQARRRIALSDAIQTMPQQMREFEEKVLMLNANSFKRYMDGVTQGMAPGVNVAKLAGTSTVGSPSIKGMDQAELTGFFGAFSLYATTPLAYMALGLLKRVR